MKLGVKISLVQLTFVIGIVFCIGCGPATPDILPVSGVVSINGKPLPNAAVRFVPMAEGLGGSHVASGTTNKDGEFSLRLQGEGEEGCCACLCKVTIDNPAMPKEVRAASESGDQNAVPRYKRSLKNRPIPSNYRLLRTTPLSFEVSAEQSEFNIEIER